MITMGTPFYVWEGERPEYPLIVRVHHILPNGGGLIAMIGDGTAEDEPWPNYERADLPVEPAVEHKHMEKRWAAFLLNELYALSLATGQTEEYPDDFTRRMQEKYNGGAL